MSEREDRLGKKEIERILREQVIPESGLDELTSHERPKAIVLAGQPGAGKASLVRAAELEFGDDILPVDPDRLRNGLPGVRQLQEADPFGWPGKTNADAFRLAGGLRDAGVDARVNLVIDGSMSDADNSIRTIRALQQQGYEVEIRAISAHWFESELGIDRRFTTQLDQEGVARDVDMDFHNRVYRDLPDNLQKVSQATGAPALIYDRELNVLYDSRRDLAPADAVLREMRSGRMEDPEIRQQLSEKWQEQRSWHEAMPDTLRARQDLSPSSAEALIAGHAERRALERAASRAEGIAAIETPAHVRGVELPPLSRAGTVAGMAGLGLAAAAVDAQVTGERIGTAYAQDNPIAARSEATQFIARGVGGAAAGFTPAALGVSGGPALALAVADGVLLTEAFDRGAKFLDRNRIVFQTDRDGVAWEFIGKQWVRDDLRADLRDDGVDKVQRQTFAALPDKARELSYLASVEAVSQAIGKTDPRDPFVQPANDSDPAHLKVRDWTRDADSGRWSRTVADDVDRNDRPLWKPDPEVASPARAAELDRQAVQSIDRNIIEGPAALAMQYQIGHKRSGFDTAGEVPAVVQTALNPDTREASNGQQYRRDAQGQWSHDGEIARGNLALELDLTRERLLPALQQHQRTLAEVPAWQPPTPEQQDRTMLRQAYADRGWNPSPEQFEASYLAVQRTREATGVTAERTALVLGEDANGKFSLDSPVHHLQREGDGVVRVAATTTREDITLARSDATARERDGDISRQASPVQAIPQATPEQRDAREQTQREANRQGLSQDEVQRAVAAPTRSIAGGQRDVASREQDAPRDDAQQKRADNDHAAPTTTTSAPIPPPARPSDPRDPDHPDHRLHKQIETGVARIDADNGRTFDATSERLTMGAFHDAKAARMTSADHVVLNQTGAPQRDGSQTQGNTLLIAIQGQDPYDPAAKRSITDVKQAVEQPLEHLLQKVNVLEQQQQQTQTPQPDNPTPDTPGPKGPTR